MAPLRFPLPDLRDPGQPMQPLAVKLPACTIARLDRTAEALRTTRTALGRALIVHGLAELEQATTTAQQGQGVA